MAWIFLSSSTKKNIQIESDLVSLVDTSIEDFDVDELAMQFTVDSIQLDSPLLQRDFFGFKEAVGHSESRGIYTLVNKFGFMGKYQFGKSALASIGIYDTTGFIDDPEFQEEAFYAFTARNKFYMRDMIEQYEGKIVGGILITESGILAATHLAGPGGVRRFLQSNGAQSKSDAFGTQVQHYMKEFAGYDLSAVKPNKKPKVQRKSKNSLAQL